MLHIPTLFRRQKRKYLLPPKTIYIFFSQLEAGGDETEISDVPALAAYLQLGSMDWKYKTEPQPGSPL